MGESSKFTIFGKYEGENSKAEFDIELSVGDRAETPARTPENVGTTEQMDELAKMYECLHSLVYKYVTRFIHVTEWGKTDVVCHDPLVMKVAKYEPPDDEKLVIISLKSLHHIINHEHIILDRMCKEYDLDDEIKKVACTREVGNYLAKRYIQLCDNDDLIPKISKFIDINRRMSRARETIETIEMVITYYFESKLRA